MGYIPQLQDLYHLPLLPQCRVRAFVYSKFQYGMNIYIKHINTPQRLVNSAGIVFKVHPIIHEYSESYTPFLGQKCKCCLWLGTETVQHSVIHICTCSSCTYQCYDPLLPNRAIVPVIHFPQKRLESLGIWYIWFKLCSEVIKFMTIGRPLRSTPHVIPITFPIGLSNALCPTPPCKCILQLALHEMSNL